MMRVFTYIVKTKTHIKYIGAYALLLAVLVGAGGAFAASGSATVPVRMLCNVRLRSGAGMQYPQTGIAHKGEILRSTVADGEWTIVRYHGAEAYVATRYLEEVEDSAFTDGYVRALEDTDVLKGPSIYAKKVATASPGEIFPVIQELEDWYLIAYYGRQGVVSKLYMESLSAGRRTPLPETDGRPTENGEASDAAEQSAAYVPAQKGAYVEAKSFLYIRSSPERSGTQIGQAYRGYIYKKLGTIGDWVSIEYNYRVAYVYGGDVADSSFTPGQIVQDGDYDSAAKELIDAINASRTKEGKSPLIISNTLMECAKVRAEDITEVFSHTRPDGTMCNSLAPNEIFGENIAKGAMLPTADAAAKSFLDADAHKTNALSDKYTKTGAACININGEVFWVQLFG